MTVAHGQQRRSFIRHGRVVLGMVLALLLVSPVSAESESIPALRDDSITGAGAHFSWLIFNELKPGLEKKFGRKITLYGRQSMLGAGCNAGIKTAQKSKPGTESFGFVCCPLDPKEVEREKLKVYPLAIEPIVILLNKENPVRDLSAEQVRAIFRGDIRNWVEVGGPDQPIVVVTRLHCKKRPGHWKTILPSAELFRRERLNVKSAAEMVKRVEDFPFSIGHTGSTWDFGTEGNVKTITVGGVYPNGANLKNKRYPFFRQLSAVTSGPVSKDLQKILHEVQTGPEFGALADKYGLLPLKQ